MRRWLFVSERFAGDNNDPVGPSRLAVVSEAIGETVVVVVVVVVRGHPTRGGAPPPPPAAAIIRGAVPVAVQLLLVPA